MNAPPPAPTPARNQFKQSCDNVLKPANTDMTACYHDWFHCQISYGGGLGMSPCIQKEHTKLYKILIISFVLIGPILNKIKPFKNFKNLKIY